MLTLHTSRSGGMPLWTPFGIQRMRVDYPTENFHKVSTVRDLKLLGSCGSGSTKMKLNGIKVTTSCLPYFHSMLLNLNSLQALHILPLDKKKQTCASTLYVYYHFRDKTPTKGKQLFGKKELDCNADLYTKI